VRLPNPERFNDLLNGAYQHHDVADTCLPLGPCAKHVCVQGLAGDEPQPVLERAQLYTVCSCDAEYRESCRRGANNASEAAKA
jgi:hypothetical protein